MTFLSKQTGAFANAMQHGAMLQIGTHGLETYQENGRVYGRGGDDGDKLTRRK